MSKPKASKEKTVSEKGQKGSSKPNSVLESDKTQQNLTPRQLLALEALSAGATDAGAALKSGLSRSHVNELRNRHPEFMAELARRRESIWRSTLESMRVARLQAITHVRELIADKEADPELRLRAAMGVLDLFPPPVGDVSAPPADESNADRIARRLALEEFNRNDRRSETEQLLEAMNGGPDLSREIHRVWLEAERIDFACEEVDDVDGVVDADAESEGEADPQGRGTETLSGSPE